MCSGSENAAVRHLAMRTDERSVVNFAERIRAEYVEMPGL
jgi:hypothetical protein